MAETDTLAFQSTGTGASTGTGTGPKLTDGPPPPEGSDNVGKFFWNKFQICKQEKDRLNMHSKWMRNYELKRGRHFRTTTSKWPLVPINIFYIAVSRTKAHLTDSKPRFEIVAHDENSQDQAPMMNAAANNWYKRTQQLKKHSDSIDNGETYGSTIEKMVFNPALEGGKGDIEAVVNDPFKIFPWPGVREIQNMPYFFEIEVLELEDIQRIWPETGKDVQPDMQFSTSTLVGKERELIKAGTLANHRAMDNLPNNFAPSGGRVSELGINRAMIVEGWIKDFTIIDEEIEQEVPITVPDQDPDSETFGQEIPTGEMDMQKQKTGRRVPKYPGFIRVVHLANEGRIVLDDVPNPSINPTLPAEQAENFYLFDKLPYLKTDSNTDTSNFWAFSVIEQIEILGKEINKKISQVAAYIDKTVRPTLINPKTTGIDKHMVSNLPGQMWRPVNHLVSQSIRYLEMPSLPPDFYVYIELLLRLVDNITGIQDVTEGRKPKGISAASAIIALQEKAQTMFREKIRNYDLALEEKGRMWISLAQNWYTEERKIRLSGKALETMGPFGQFKGTEMQGEFTFEVVPGSTLPKSLFVRLEQSVQLFNAGAIDQKALLEAFDFPNSDEIIRRMSLGQLGLLIERLQVIGAVDEETLAIIQQVGSLDEKEFNKLANDVGQQGGGSTDGGTSQTQPSTQPGGGS